MPRKWGRPFITVFLLAILILTGCSQNDAPQKMETGANPDLAAHSAEFKPEIIKVTEGVYVAVGYGLANAILLVGQDGVVIVDGMESAEAALPVKEAFNKISDQPVKAIIYTHYHSDHTNGTKILAGDDAPKIISHESTKYYLSRIATITRETTYRRAMRQFGTLLPEGGLINAGIGPFLNFDENKTIAALTPTNTFSTDSLELEIAGLKIVLIHAPGETPDQIVVWLPDKKVLLPADNFYKSFPNLYAIRGTAYRDVILWVKSLDKMRALKADYMVPSHTRPVAGAEKIFETLTNYRDAIQFVHDQTIRLMNAGLTPQEIVEQVKLPAHLARQPYLHEYYGTVEWSVRAIFDGYLGWFGGNATNLFPLTMQEKATHFATLAGGKNALYKHAQKAVADKNYKWALEVCDQLLKLDPDAKKVRELKADALEALGQKQISATARNYYLTQALELRGQLTIGMMKIRQKDVIHSLSLADIFKAMTVKLDPKKSADANIKAGFRFPDTKEAFTVHVRRGVAEIQPGFPQDPDLALTVNSRVWKEVAAGVRNPTVAFFKDMDKEGGILKLIKFLAMFKSE
jgi:alkyl sulfatase BDS1-like metallo-beta-lactamase superfamily hydrolase